MEIMTNNIWIQSHLPNEDNSFIEENIQSSFKQVNIKFDDIEKSQLKWFNVLENPETTNINSLSRFFNEYCVLYYVWKNQIQSDIVSFSHYKRIVFPRHIKKEFLLSHDYFQFYDGINLPEHKLWMYKYSPEFSEKYYLMLGLMKMTNFPTFIIEDMKHYLSVQTYISQPTLQRYVNYRPGPYSIIRRSIFSCNWNMFNKLMRFINGFFTYFMTKHNLEYTEESLYNFWIERIIPHYRNFNKDEFNEILTFAIEDNHLKPNEKNAIIQEISSDYHCYSDDNTFREIFNPETNFGYNAYCNIWRIFGYLTELLVAVYIHCEDYFSLGGCPFQIGVQHEGYPEHFLDLTIY